MILLRWDNGLYLAICSIQIGRFLFGTRAVLVNIIGKLNKWINVAISSDTFVLIAMNEDKDA